MSRFLPTVLVTLAIAAQANQKAYTIIGKTRRVKPHVFFISGKPATLLYKPYVYSRVYNSKGVYPIQPYYRDGLTTKMPTLANIIPNPALLWPWP